MRVLINTDLEGCAGIFNRELQVTNATPQEWAKTLRLCTGEVIAAIEGAWAGGATKVWIHAIHDIDLEMLPPDVQVIRGVGGWDGTVGEVIYQRGDFDAMVVVGQHGGSHLLDCALAHTILPSWQLEVSTGFQQGWVRQVAPHIGDLKPGEFSTVKNVWLNGRLCGETSLIMAMAAGFGIRTVCVSGDSHACAEAQELVPEVEMVPVKWGVHFRAARMLSPSGARNVIRSGVERALKRLSGIPIKSDGPQEIKVQYVHPQRADRSGTWPGVHRMDACTISATAPSGRDIPGLRFLFARPANAEEGPTALETYDPPDWLTVTSPPSV